MSVGVCPSWGVWTWFLSMLEWRSMAHTTARCFWLKSYCLSVHVCGNLFIFLQDNVPAHRAHEKINLLIWKIPVLITAYLSSPNSTYLNPVDYNIWWEMQQWVSSKRRRSTEAALDRCIMTLCRAMMQLMSGANVSVCEFVWKEDLSNI